MRSRRATVLAGLLVLAALAVAGSATTAAQSSNPVTSRVLITHEGTNDRIAGVANYRTGRARLFANYDMSGNSDLGLTPGLTPMEDLEARGVSFMKLGSCADRPCWWRIDHSAVPVSANLDQLATEDPFRLAALIKAAAVAQNVEGVRGVPTTHYAGAIDVEHLLAPLSPENRASATESFADLEEKDGGVAGLPASVWLDDRGLPRRIRIERLGSANTWEYYDFGVDARVALPVEADIMTSADLEAFMTGASK